MFFRSQADVFLTALVIFVAPIVAVTDYLGKYRLHATNLFQTAAARPSPTQIAHRIAMRGALLAELQKWLHRNGPDLRSADLRAYFTQWKRAQEHDGFLFRGARAVEELPARGGPTLDLWADHDSAAPDL